VPETAVFRLGIGSTSHQAVAEALHIELTFVASPVCGFGQLRSDYLATFLSQRREVWVFQLLLLRGVTWSRQRDETKH
jgi:hypothetical protein